MAWVIVIGILIFLCIKYPGFRKFAIGIAVLIILTVAWFIFSMQHDEQVRKTLITKDQIDLGNFTLKTGSISDYYYLSSPQVKNNSDHELTGMNMTVTAYDCPTSSITSDCETIGQDTNVDIYIDVPAHQVRAMNSNNGYVTNGGSVSLYNMPKIKGQFLWSYDITSITGKD